MAPETITVRTRRTWTEKLRMWPRAYETRITEGHFEAVGRGPTRKVSRETALELWRSEETSASTFRKSA